MPMSSVEKGGQELAVAWLRRGPRKLPAATAKTPRRISAHDAQNGGAQPTSDGAAFHSETQRGFFRA